MTSKQKYISQQENYRSSVSLFHTPDWLNTVCEDEWDVVIYEVDHKIVAAMPYHVKKKYGITAHINPKLTPYLGPWYMLPSNVTKQESKHSWRKKALKSLVDHLPSASYVNLSCTTEIADILPFVWSKYRQRTRYTYHINPGTESDLRSGLSAKTRNQIKSASDQYDILLSDDIDTFVSLVKQTYAKQGLDIVMGEQVYRNIYRRFAPEGRCEIVLGTKDGSSTAGIMLVSDETKVYYLASGKSDDAHGGAVAALIFDSIVKASKAAKIFDFEGSDIPSIESFFRSFGGRLMPYHQIFKSANRLTDAALMVIGKLP